MNEQYIEALNHLADGDWHAAEKCFDAVIETDGRFAPAYVVYIKPDSRVGVRV